MKLLYSVLALATLATAGTALAADLPSRRAPPVYIPPPIPVFSWTGFYAGGQVGYEFGEDSAIATPGGIAVAAGFVPFAYGTRPNGVIGGAHIGYNWQAPGLGAGLFGGGLVLGIEGDVDGVDDRSTAVVPGPFGLPAAGGVVYAQNHRKDVEGSVRGRLGIAVDRALFYVTGGAAFAQFHDGYTIAVGPVTAGSVAGAATRVGWTAGAGVEYAVTPNWTLRAEYRYTDFGTYGYDISGTAGVGVPAGTLGATNRITDNRVQVGFSYLFSTPAAVPVVARY